MLTMQFNEDVPHPQQLGRLVMLRRNLQVVRLAGMVAVSKAKVNKHQRRRQRRRQRRQSRPINTIFGTFVVTFVVMPKWMTFVIVHLIRWRTSIDWRILWLHFPVNYASGMGWVQHHQDMA
jgi:hypothetical protein